MANPRAKETTDNDTEDIKLSMEKLTDILVQNFKNYFEQWPKRWEHCMLQVLQADLDGSGQLHAPAALP
jgi:hypothetical protein